MKLYFDSLTTLKVIHAESLVVIFFGTYGRSLKEEFETHGKSYNPGSKCAVSSLVGKAEEVKEKACI